MNFNGHTDSSFKFCDFTKAWFQNHAMLFGLFVNIERSGLFLWARFFGQGKQITLRRYLRFER